MKSPPLPDNEALRLQTLHDLQALDTLPDAELDRLTEFAAHVFNVPIALISLVDSDRQWFKSRVGLDAEQTPRDISFCGHAICQEDVFVIDNAAKDERFYDNPLVSEGLSIRFYAGCPLRHPNGCNLGTLCLIDSEPREFNEHDASILKQVADDVVERLIKLARP
ncbi:histidine kinase [Pseudoalteromonas rubra]|uniref:Histidine kinase n=1 Tax=Pseudoalteromonas rubra TaxID=43658 RepID=A0A5S3WIV3_9GAMM|nr:GAF domain-containing protein [Pseudoalteromonas rubra]TMP26108.1 histidine kinase [Pseudoalteromonas rubra]TMP29757.1 histidine kinase [Pseudoalteromonas rubra]